MDFGDLLIRLSVRLAMACYAGVLLGCAIGRRAPATTSASRVLWTLGCWLFLLHVASAFHFYHHWSHEHAFRDTAEKTRAAIGWEIGYGVYVNHLFALVWTGDVVWSWAAPQSFVARPRWLTIAIHAFLLFIVVNGLMVFKDGAVRWVSAAIALGIAALWCGMWLAGKSTASPTAAHDEVARP